MAYSHKDSVRIMENELSMYWRLSKEAHEIARQGKSTPELEELCDEAQVLGQMTDWPLLRTLCASSIVLVLPAERIAECAG